MHHRKVGRHTRIFMACSDRISVLFVVAVYSLIGYGRCLFVRRRSVESGFHGYCLIITVLSIFPVFCFQSQLVT